MKKEFFKYLKGQFSSSATPAKYLKSVENVMDEEGLGWFSLARNIDYICSEYDIGGSCEEIGTRNHNFVLSALKKYREFLVTEGIIPDMIVPITHTKSTHSKFDMSKLKRKN